MSFLYQETKIALQIMILGLCLFASIWAFYKIIPILLPFVLALIFAYIAYPISSKLHYYGISKSLAAILVILIYLSLISLFLLIFFPILHDQTLKLIDIISKLQPNLINKEYLTQLNMLDLSQHKKLMPWLSSDLFKNLDILGTFLKTILSSGRALIEAVIFFILTPVLTFYFLRDKDNFLEKLFAIVPHKFKMCFEQLIKEWDIVLRRFFRGQLLIMLFLSIYYALTLSLTGLQSAILIGMIIGFLSILPYLGAIIGILLAALISLIQFASLKNLLLVGLVFIVGHSIENFYLTPKVMGDKLGLHPAFIIF